MDKKRSTKSVSVRRLQSVFLCHLDLKELEVVPYIHIPYLPINVKLNEKLCWQMVGRKEERVGRPICEEGRDLSGPIIHFPNLLAEGEGGGGNEKISEEEGGRTSIGS